MNLFKPFTLHFYSYRKIFLVSFFLLTAATLLTVFMLNDFGIFYYFTIFFIVFHVLLSFALGFYEYNHLCDHYLNLKTNRFGFFLSSLVFGLGNALYKTAFALLVFLLLSITKETKNGVLVAYTVPFPYLKITTFLLIFGLHFVIFLMANLMSLILRKVHFGWVFIYSAALLLISVFFQNITTFLSKQTALFFSSPSLFTFYLPIIGLLGLFLALIVAWQASTIDLKK